MTSHGKKCSALILLSCTLLLFFTACSGPAPKSDSREEGQIEFTCSPVDPSHPMSKVAPKKATLKFKGDKLAMEFTSMGIVRTTIIQDNTAKTRTQIVQYLTTNIGCIETEAQIAEGNHAYQLDIEETNEQKVIAGQMCYKAHVKKVLAPESEFDVWYAKDLGNKTINALTPFSTIEGVLLDYRLVGTGLDMHFTATEYRNIKIPDEAFVVPASVKMTTREAMMEALHLPYSK